MPVTPGARWRGGGSLSSAQTGFFFTDAVRAKLAAITSTIPLAVSRALYEVALEEAKESMKRTPVDTGALRASHEVQPPKWSGRDLSVMIQVGGPAAGYAVIVHEDLEADHKVGQAKFLESTLNESGPHIPKRVANRILTF